MLGFVRQFIPYRGLPIGVDLGEHTIRLAQVEQVNEEHRLVHADEIHLESDLNSEKRSASVVAAIKAAFRRGNFMGRRIAVGLPASAVQIKHLRMPRVSAEEFANSLAEHASVALNAPASNFLLRGVVAGDVFGEQSPQQEVVLFATPHDTIHQLMEDAAAARVEIVGVHPQQKITTEFFSRIYRRNIDETAVNLFVDLGATGTRAFVSAPSDLRFVRPMSLSVSQLHERIARQLAMPANEVALMRRDLITRQTGHPNNLSPGDEGTSTVQQKLLAETSAAAGRLSEELEMCRRYYEATFPNQPVTRLIFVGGGARDRLLCSAIAQTLSLPAQIGDALVRFNRTSLPPIPCIDRREAMPQWSTAFGLSMCGQTVTLA